MSTTAPETGGVGRGLHLTGERLPFAMLPRWLLYHGDVNEGAKFLYCVLHDLVNGREGPTRPVTRGELASACAVSADTIDRRLAQLVAVGAVEKEPQIRAGGQQANVYRVWLTPPGGLHRNGENPGDNRGRTFAAPVEGGANPQLRRSRESAAPEAGPHGCGTSGRVGAAPIRKEEQEEIPPQPPRTAGGHGELESEAATTGSRRISRGAGTNPRAEAERGEAARFEAEAARRQGELEARTEARRAADLDAEREAQRLEAEALSISAALDDETLCSVVAQVTAGLSGLLAGSPLAIARAVVAWCRTAVTVHPGPLAEAAASNLTEGIVVGEESPPAQLDLPPAPAGTALLRHRIAALVRPGGGAE